MRERPTVRSDGKFIINYKIKKNYNDKKAQSLLKPNIHTKSKKKNMHKIPSHISY